MRQLYIVQKKKDKEQDYVMEYPPFIEFSSIFNRTPMFKAGAKHLAGQALAKTVYARNDITVLDDCFSSLEGHNENYI
jgi:hypothetical protein